ncbi:MAG: hypothetical protein U5K75_04715 [Ahrensia sp.]|nr:hypothetical protein [Ahrensia sp.]
MKIQPINAIEGALLQTRFVEMPLDGLADVVSAALRKCHIMGVADVLSRSHHVTIFRSHGYYISITQKNLPLARAGFGGCLPQPITKIMMPDAEQRVDAHTAHVFVSITRSPSVASLDLDEEGYSFGDFRKSDDAHRAMTLGYWVLNGLHLYNPATAVHWLPSDHLVSTLHFEAAAKEPTLTRFFIRPYLYSSAGSIAAGNPIGLVANGSQYLMEKPVIFDQASVDYRWLIERSDLFIDEVLAKAKATH